MCDGGVVSFDFSRGRAGDDENFDFLPPPANGPPEPGRLRLLRGFHQPDAQDGEEYFDVGVLGKRFVDIFTEATGSGVEVKVGRTGKGVSNQMLKDAAQIKSGALKSVEWVFLKSPITGKIGPTAKLKELLLENGIPWSEK